MAVAAERPYNPGENSKEQQQYIRLTFHPLWRFDGVIDKKFVVV
jgi:hypothetical protein